ncbi:hypothetical protein AN640_06770 [Candidatus Epulonipiscium fishelsonii]|uniref:Uncharacterized protein n=1 Tax=Candidatus Epulonipiscium fishelsonii TaxID=77094 RepID=A0ACC8XHI1_9FIRM|nr:hypothetical protein AN640_06770 [Epulopiscium sp. SCG-D08WGA-EpuloA1]
MMGLTHLFIGTASALALTSSVYGIIPALIGGSIGGTISDIDTKNSIFSKYFKIKNIVIAIVIDLVLQGPILHYIFKANKVILLFGIILFFILLKLGKAQKHRGPTHSILALTLFSVSIAFFSLPILPAFIIGFISHLTLDILNKKPVNIFYPYNKGICLKFCYANKSTNTTLLFVGIIFTVYFLIF